jgi:hypothetical protein
MVLPSRALSVNCIPGRIGDLADVDAVYVTVKSLIPSKAITNCTTGGILESHAARLTETVLCLIFPTL